MSTFDRSFIKAFAASPSRPAEPRATKAPAAAVRAMPTALPTAGAAPRPAGADKSPGRQATLDTPTESRRAPLSVFASETVVRESFRPAHEMERIAWPAVCDKLVSRARSKWTAFIDGIVERVGQGKKCIAITSAHRSEGRTSVCLATARELAATGLRPVVVDVDVENPGLARACALSIEIGWDVLAKSDLPLGEVLIESIADGLTLMPWRGPAVSLADLAGNLRIATAFGLLSQQYDVVLLDTMPLGDPRSIADFARFGKAIHLDAAYVVQDIRWTLEEQLVACCTSLREAGVRVEGIIENYVPRAAGAKRATPQSIFSAASRALVATTQAALGN
jgi:Mrp family chromosome partitioning ATPase